MSIAPLAAPEAAPAPVESATPILGAPVGDVLEAVQATPEQQESAGPQRVKIDLNGQPYTELDLTPEAVTNYVQTKEMYIRQQQEMLNSVLQNQQRSPQFQQQQPQPQGDPIATKRASIESGMIKRYQDRGYEITPELRGSLQPIVDSQLEIWQETQGAIRSSQMQSQFDSEYNSIRAVDPTFDLGNPIIQRVIQENPNRSPREHFALYKTFYAPQQPAFPATPAFQGANGAVGQRPQQQYYQPPQGAAPMQPGRTADSPMVTQMVEAARKAGMSGTDLASVRQRAINLERGQ